MGVAIAVVVTMFPTECVLRLFSLAWTMANCSLSDLPLAHASRYSLLAIRYSLRLICRATMLREKRVHICLHKSVGKYISEGK